jgi:hypothetical protein
MLKHGLSFVGLAALLALTIDSSGFAQGAAQGRSCFRSRDIRSAVSPDMKTVNLRVLNNEVYQLTLFASCPDVIWSRNVALRTSASDRICEGSGLNVDVLTNQSLTRSSSASRAMNTSPRSRCKVTNVRLLTKDEVAALPARARP